MDHAVQRTYEMRSTRLLDMLALSCVLARRWHGSIWDGDSDLSSRRERERERERELPCWTGYFRYRWIQSGVSEITDAYTWPYRYCYQNSDVHSSESIETTPSFNRNIFQYSRYFDIKSIFPGFLRHYYACHVMAHYIFSCVSYDNWNIPYGVYSFRSSWQSCSFLSFDSYLCFISICLVQGTVYTS